MKKIKILFTIPNFDTAGSGKALLNIAKGLDTTIFEPHIMCLHNRGAFFKVVKNSKIPIHVHNYIPTSRPFLQMFRESWQVSRYLKKINPDIIHSYHYSANYTEALAAKVAGIPWVFTKKNMNWGGNSSNAWKLRSFLANKIAVQNTDMSSTFYRGSKKTVLIPRGIDIAHFESKNDYPQLDNRFVICVANFVPVKGIETLIHAFCKVSNKHKNWNLLLVGDTASSYGEELINIVGNIGMNKKITFTGKVLDVRPYLNRSEIFVLPTKNEGRREGSPVALLEAMANGKVVIGSNIPGIKDQLANFPNFLFDPSKVDNLVIKLDHYMNQSKDELKKIGMSFCKHVKVNYPIEKEIKKHEALYNTIVKK
ncbi:glycosyltransferase [Marixanthomonas sp. SCSIO 43207]|uniref:glycosyltransferase n=1 Tax=Marixanthomonas sp. SCSIO 43207 TaxID=2779360 RepID=UPI001CAA3CAF|nr:glycosyltransferase [Marixanthomonas sp. SCSIO 43207]UAB81216.1 glycosyltransferase [Marixanthomonas sp. SCSIO 43207]